MKYQWLEEEITCASLSKELGITVTQITRGEIITGWEDVAGDDGQISRQPITRRGVEIEFGGHPTASQLSQLDTRFTGLRRSS